MKVTFPNSFRHPLTGESYGVSDHVVNWLSQLGLKDHEGVPLAQGDFQEKYGLPGVKQNPDQQISLVSDSGDHEYDQAATYLAQQAIQQGKVWYPQAGESLPPQYAMQAAQELKKKLGRTSAFDKTFPVGTRVMVNAYEGFDRNGQRGEVVHSTPEKTMVVLDGEVGGRLFGTHFLSPEEPEVSGSLWPDTLPWGEEGNEYYRNAKTAGWWDEPTPEDPSETQEIMRRRLQRAQQELQQQYQQMTPPDLSNYFNQMDRDLVQQWNALPPSEDNSFYQNSDPDYLDDKTDAMWEFKNNWRIKIYAETIKRDAIQIAPHILNSLLDAREFLQNMYLNGFMAQIATLRQLVSKETANFNALESQWGQAENYMGWYEDRNQWVAEQIGGELQKYYNRLKNLSWYLESNDTELRWVMVSGYDPNDPDAFAERIQDLEEHMEREIALGNMSEEQAERSRKDLAQAPDWYEKTRSKLDEAIEIMLTIKDLEAKALKNEVSDTFPQEWLSRKIARWRRHTELHDPAVAPAWMAEPSWDEEEPCKYCGKLNCKHKGNDGELIDSPNIIWHGDFESQDPHGVNL